MATSFITLTGVKYSGIRLLHDLLAKLLSKWLRHAKIPHMGGVGGFKRTCRGLFTKFANQLPEPDLNIKTLLLPRPYGSDRASSPVS